ncbi:hypothetical protein [Williamsia sp.]|nr:hypothetical protein [Williamsia sp.]MBJ7291071.1 hypothetical protein [Williamsia sp.]
MNGTLTETKTTLNEVKGLLAELKTQLDVLDRLPAMEAKLDQIHDNISDR